MSIARLQLAALALLLTFSLAGCTVCHEQIWDRSTSPDGQWTTSTTTRDCGAITAQMVGVYLQRPSSNPRKLGEVVFIVRRQHPVRVAWIGPQSLVITCPACGGDVKITRTEAHGIHIAYQIR